MKFLVDCCAGRRLAEWLRSEGYDVFDAGRLEHDPGDAALLKQAAAEGRVLVTLDNDFGELVFVGRARHAGVLRLPDLAFESRGIWLRNSKFSRNGGNGIPDGATEVESANFLAFSAVVVRYRWRATSLT